MHRKQPYPQQQKSKYRLVLQWLLWVVLLLCQYLPALAQPEASVTVTTDKIQLGEQLEMQLQLKLPAGWKFPTGWFVVADSFNHLEVLEKGDVKTFTKDNWQYSTQKLKVTSFDSGTWNTPAFSLKVDNNNTVSTNSVTIFVSPIRDTLADYHDIKDIVPVTGFKWLWWIIGGGVFLFLLILGLVGWFIFRRKKKPAAVVQTYTGSAFEEAMKALQQLKQEQWIEKGEVKLHYTKLADIFRLYVYRRTGTRTQEKTSAELLVPLKSMITDHDSFSQLAATLRMTDAVKFARYVPEAADNSTNYHTIGAAIEYIEKRKT
jgi:hypothetical protein